MNGITLTMYKWWTMFTVNNKSYTLDSFLTVENYVKKLILNMYNREIKYDTQKLQGIDKINRTLVYQIKNDKFVTLPELKPNVHVDSVVIEGNDVSGKETYSRFLHLDLDKTMAVAKVDNTQSAHLISFPNYTSQIGKLIAKLLRKRNKTNFDRYLLNWLFCYDRINTMMNMFDEFNNQSDIIHHHHVLVFDRFYQSNWIYNQMDSRDAVVDWLLRTEKVVFDKTNIKDVIIFHRDKHEPDEVHDKLIKDKKNKDLNETIEFQKVIRDRFITSRFYKKLKVNHYTGSPKIHYFTVKEVVVDDKPRESAFLTYIHKSLNLFHSFVDK